jgi:hypothetical protein
MEIIQFAPACRRRTQDSGRRESKPDARRYLAQDLGRAGDANGNREPPASGAAGCAIGFTRM